MYIYILVYTYIHALCVSSVASAVWRLSAPSAAAATQKWVNKGVRMADTVQKVYICKYIKYNECAKL